MKFINLRFSGLRCTYLWLTFICCKVIAVGPQDENVAAIVRFSNSLVPPLFQTYSANTTNLVLAPFGLATSIAIIMECVSGEGFSEITRLFKLQDKAVRQQLRRGFKTILDDFQQGVIRSDELAGSYNKAHLLSSKAFPETFMDQLTKFYSVEITSNASLSTNKPLTAQVLELRSDSGVMSHWKDYQKLAVYTYLSYSPAAPFLSSLENTTFAPMIPLVGIYRSGRIDRLSCQGVELLFENKKISLILLMPDSINGLSNLQSKLFKENFFHVIDSLPRKEVQIFLPQLSTVTNGLEMSSFLKMLGVISAFTEYRDRDAHPTETYVQSIRQNAFFSTSFTALNSVGSVSTRIGLKKHPDFQRQKRDTPSNKITFNKPFLYFLIHRESGLILLAGQIIKPTQVPS